MVRETNVQFEMPNGDEYQTPLTAEQRETLDAVSFAGIILGIILWVLLFFLVGQTGGTHPAVVPAVVTAWVLLPVSVGVNATLEPQCSKRYAVLYTLGCAVPLFGIVPASVYLGYTHHP